MPHLKVLSKLGAPVESRLHQAKLPTISNDRPGVYLSLPRVLDFLARSERSQGIEDLALRGALGMASARLEPGLDAALARAPTLHAALRAMCAFGAREAPCVEWWIQVDDAADVKACGRVRVDRAVNGRHYSEWYQNLAWVNIVRAFAGPDWHPREMGFESQAPITRFARGQYPDTRFHTGQLCAWVDIPRGLLSRPRWVRRSGNLPQQPAPSDRVEPAGDLPTSLKLLLKSYLPQGYPDIALSAEIIGMSVRTLQRRLAAAGMSYSDVVDQARFEAAADLMKHSGLKLIDVAYDLGYEDPSSFARAFRRIAGVSPREYRKQAIAEIARSPLAAPIDLAASPRSRVAEVA